MKKLNLVGHVYGRLTVLEETSSRRWKCQCECGGEHEASTCGLRAGRVKSCGCYRREQQAKRAKTHGGTGDRTHWIWLGMKKRCRSETSKDYPRYGGRGIDYAPRWDDYEDFVADMGCAPEGKSLDRIDNDGPYTKGNCRWATPTEQTRNRRCAVRYEGVAAADIAEQAGVTISTVYRRLRCGLDPYIGEKKN